jgi:hypothetical protein
MRSAWILAGRGCFISVSATLIFSAEMAQSAPEWSGGLTCNLDGRPAVLELEGITSLNWCWLDKERGYMCTRAGELVAGRLSDNGGPWQPIETRPFYPDRGEKREYTHIIPLRLNNEPWLLLMHTWDNRYMSGYTT